MVRYSLSSNEHEFKRAIRRIQKEIKQGIFVDIPLDFIDIFDNEFYVKLANTIKLDNDNDYEINGNETTIKNIDLHSHEYKEDQTMYFIDSSQLKEALEKYSYTLADDLRLIILALLPQSVRELSKDDYISNQFKFIS